MVLSCLDNERVKELRKSIRDTLQAALLHPNPNWLPSITDAKIDAAEAIIETGGAAQIEIAIDVLAEGIKGKQNFSPTAQVRAARVLDRALGRHRVLTTPFPTEMSK